MDEQPQPDPAAKPQPEIATPLNPSPPHSTKWLWIVGAVALLALAAFAYYAFKPKPAANISVSPASASPSATTSHSGCTITATLVNSCRAWVGAAAAGNPGAGKDQVSQFTYLESLIGRKLDIYRSYHAYPGAASSTADQPLNPAEIQFAARTGTYLDVNWNPSSSWQQSMPVSQGGDAAANANIDAVAKSIRSVAPHKVFLSLWHEANLLVDAPDPGDAGQAACQGTTNTARQYGSPSQFNAAWRNVYQRFQAAGATNVVWVLNFSSYAPKSCWVKYLWPGNQYVDWVIYDTYSRGQTWDQTAGVFYKTLTAYSTSAEDFNSKPWGIGEFGTCSQTTKGISGAAYYQSVKAAVDANTYPKLKMYLVYADTGNNAGPGCLTNYDSNSQPDPAKQQAFNALYNDPAFSGQ